MSNKCNPRMTTSCEKHTLATGDTEKAAYLAEDISVCLPFGGELYTDGGILKHEPASNPPADGVYGKVVVKNGCIVDVQPEDVAIHTSAPCAPIPSPCDCAGGGSSGGGGMAQPSTTSGNLFEYDAAGRPLVRVFMEEGSGVTIDGSGTKSDPYILSSSAVSGGSSVIAAGALDYEEMGNQTVITHREGKAAAISGMEFDAYGHLIGYSAPDGSSTVKNVTSVLGDNYTTTATMDQMTGIAKVMLKKPDYVYEDTFLLGGYEIELDEYNRIEHVKRKRDFPAGNYVFGDYTVAIADDGVIESATPKADSGAVMTCASKYFSANQIDWTLNFVTDTPSSFRISIKCSAQPQALAVIIDDVNYSTVLYRFGQNHMEVVPNATFPAGSHQIYIVDQENGNPITPSAIVDVFLATVV